MKLDKLNNNGGINVAGCIVDEHTFCGVVTTAQLLQMFQDPRLSEVKSARDGSVAVSQYYEVRKEVQRMFEGDKKKNVEPYCSYLLAKHAGASGEVPTIICWSEQDLPYTELPGHQPAGTLQIPWGTFLVAIDGETQLAARYAAVDQMPDFRTQHASIKICHGLPSEWAKQIFHDLNSLGVKPNVATSLSMDLRDPLTNVARQIEKEVSFFTNRVNKVRRSLRKDDQDVFTIAALRAAAVMLSEGIAGTKYGAKPVEVASERLPFIRQVAIEWFRAITQTFGATMEDRDGAVMSSPTVLAAIGAVGHDLLSFSDATERRTKQDELMELLKEVDWTKGKPWAGVIGTFNASGKFTIQGTGSRGTISAAYRALRDPSSPEGRRVRNKQPLEAVV